MPYFLMALLISPGTLRNNDWKKSKKGTDWISSNTKKILGKFEWYLNGFTNFSTVI